MIEVYCWELFSDFVTLFILLIYYFNYKIIIVSSNQVNFKSESYMNVKLSKLNYINHRIQQLSSYDKLE